MESRAIDEWLDGELWDEDVAGQSINFAGIENQQTAHFSAGRVTSSFALHRELGRSHLSATRHTFVTITSHEPIAVSGAIRLADALTLLTDLIYGVPTAPCSLEVGGAGRFAPSAAVLNEDMRPDMQRNPTDRDAIVSRLLTFEDFGGVEGVARWLDLPESIWHLARRVATHYRRDGRFLEDYTLAVFATGEALERAESGTTQTPARTRWARLAGAVPEFQEHLTGMTPTEWAHEVVSVRDKLAHVLTDLDERAATHIYAVAESAHLLSVLTLFRLARISEAASNAATSYRWNDVRSLFVDRHRQLPSVN